MKATSKRKAKDCACFNARNVSEESGEVTPAINFVFDTKDFSVLEQASNRRPLAPLLTALSLSTVASTS